MDESYRTAIIRKSLSTPAKYLSENDLLVGRCLDFGCGYGTDAELLSIEKYDKFFFPCNITGKYDTVMANYVLNVVDPAEVGPLVAFIERLLKKDGTAYLTVRRDKFTHPRQHYVILDRPVLHETDRYCIYETFN